MIKKYCWRELPGEIRTDFRASMDGDSEEKVDYINRHNKAKTLGEWEQMIEEYNEGSDKL